MCTSIRSATTGHPRQGGQADAPVGGDAFLLGPRFDDIEADELARLFGTGFEAQLRDAPIGEWLGPVPSGYGVHLALVRSRVEESAPSLAAVHDAVRAEWLREQRLQANARFYEDLRSRYAVTVERPKRVDTSIAAGMQR